MALPCLLLHEADDIAPHRILRACESPSFGRYTEEKVAKMNCSRHAKFIARTVLVNNNNIDEACRVINRIMGSEGWLDQYRRTRRYEKPYMVRRRVNFEKCKAIYNEDMNRKIQFVLRANRAEPFPGC